MPKERRSAQQAASHVSIRVSAKQAVFIHGAMLEAIAMLNSLQHYELMSERAPDAAGRSACFDERLRHLETANQYARMACQERQRCKPAYIRLPISSGRAPR